MQMRTKIALLVGVMALAVASIAPAAQAKTVTLEAIGEPIQPGNKIQAYSTMFNFTLLYGGLSCQWGHPRNEESEEYQAGAIVSEVVKNKADPAVLNGFSGDVLCQYGYSPPTKVPGTSEATGPVELFGNGTGKLPIKMTLIFNGYQKCVYTGTLSVTPYVSGGSEAAIKGSVSAPGCGPGYISANMQFDWHNYDVVKFIYS